MKSFRKKRGFNHTTSTTLIWCYHSLHVTSYDRKNTKSSPSETHTENCEEGQCACTCGNSIAALRAGRDASRGSRISRGSLASCGSRNSRGGSLGSRWLARSLFFWDCWNVTLSCRRVGGHWANRDPIQPTTAQPVPPRQN